MAELPASKLQRQADAAPSWGAELERLLRALSDDEELLDEASHALQAATTGAAFDASPPVAALVRHCDTPSRRGEVASRVFYLEQDVQQRAAHVARALLRAIERGGRGAARSAWRALLLLVRVGGAHALALLEYTHDGVRVCGVWCVCVCDGT